ncbi:MAG: ABC transporter substrate-binding protein [Burkholderiaceae bacterium]
MRTIWIITALFGLWLGGCANVQTAPTPEERQALAPTGTLRVAFLANQAIHATKDPGSGELRGVVIDLGKELARRMGVPFEAVTYPTAAALLGSMQSGRWDIIVTAINPDRAKNFDLSAPYAEVEEGYLVAQGSSISAMAEVDRPGVRIALQQGGVADILLTPAIKSATLIRVPTATESLEMLKTGRADAVPGNKTYLFSGSEKVPGSRILEGRFDVSGFGIGVPKGRDRGAAYVRKFVEEAKSSGFVKAAIERAGVRGLAAAP